MSKARLIITAVVLEGRSQADVAREYQVSKGWVSKLVARHRAEGDAAFEPRSRRPLTSPNKTPDTTLELIIQIRTELTGQGLDAGTDTIVWHLEHHHQIVVSASTVHRHLRNAGLVTPEPKKRPKSSSIRFEADQPNETWQSDFTHYRLTNGVDVETISWLDDHSRYALLVTAHLRITGRVVLTTFRTAYTQHGKPASTLTDNDMVYTTRFAGGRGGRNVFETELVNHRIVQKTHRATPATVYTTRPKAQPGNSSHHAHYRVRHDRISKAGTVTIRHNSRLHHIGIGKQIAGTYVVALIDDLHIRIIDAATGEVLRDLTLDTTRDHQPTGKPPGPTPKTKTPGPA